MLKRLSSPLQLFNKDARIFRREFGVWPRDPQAQDNVTNRIREEWREAIGLSHGDDTKPADPRIMELSNICQRAQRFGFDVTYNPETRRG